MKKSDEMTTKAMPGEKGIDYSSGGDHEVAEAEHVDGLHRRLSNRQIQWIAIGGSIGTGLFVSIGWGLVEGGPGSLFIGFAIYCAILALANNCMAEMTVFMPVVGGWVRMGSKWVDEAYGFMAGWNFYVSCPPNLRGEMLTGIATAL
jgi:amino acid transporter